jgi:hypothetical protein
VLFKPLSGFTNEQQKLIFRNADYRDALAFGLDRQKVRGLVAWYE